MPDPTELQDTRAAIPSSRKSCRFFRWLAKILPCMAFVGLACLPLSGCGWIVAVTVVGAILASQGGSGSGRNSPIDRPPPLITIPSSVSRPDPDCRTAPVDASVVEGALTLHYRVVGGIDGRAWPLHLTLVHDGGSRQPITSYTVHPSTDCSGPELDRTAIEVEEFYVCWDTREFPFADRVHIEARLGNGEPAPSDEFRIDNSARAEVILGEPAGDQEAPLPEGASSGLVRIPFEIHDLDGSGPFDHPRFFLHQVDLFVSTPGSFIITRLESAEGDDLDELPAGKFVAVWDSKATFPDQLRDDVCIAIHAQDTKQAISSEANLRIDNRSPKPLEALPQTLPSGMPATVTLTGADLLDGLRIVIHPLRGQPVEVENVQPCLGRKENCVEFTFVPPPGIYGEAAIEIRNPNRETTLFQGGLHFSAAVFDFERWAIAAGKLPLDIAVLDPGCPEGNLELAVADKTGQRIAIFRSDPGGRFAFHREIPFLKDGDPLAVTSVAALDLDGDGTSDQLVGISQEVLGADHLFVVDGLGLGNPDCAGPPGDPPQPGFLFRFDTGDDRRRLEVGHLNPGVDDFPDLAVTLKTDKKIYIFRGIDRPGLYATDPVILEQKSPRAVVFADLDGIGGRKDLVIANESDNQIFVYLHDENGVIRGTLEQPLNAGQLEPEYLSAGDIDRDGDDDLIIVLTDHIMIMETARDDLGGIILNPLGERLEVKGGGDPDFAAAADLDGDEFLDIIATYKAINQVGFFFNAGIEDMPFLFKDPILAPAGIRPRQFLVRDLNRDEINDVAVISEASGEANLYRGISGPGKAPIAWFSAPAGECPIPPSTPLATGSPASNRGSIVFGDFVPGNDFLEAALVDRDRSTVNVFERREIDWSLKTCIDLSSLGTGKPLALSAIDPDGDQVDDLSLAWEGGDGRGAIALIPSGGGGLFNPPVPPAQLEGRPLGLLAGDFTGDGARHLVVLEEAPEGGRFLILEALDSGRAFSILASAPAGKSPRDFETADLDGDGKLDLLISDLESSSILLYFDPPAHASPDEPVAILVPGEPGPLAVADVNKDGFQDIAVFTIAGNEPQVCLFLGQWERVFAKSLKSVTLPDRNVAAIRLADFNRDDLPDLLAVLTRSGEVVILPGNRTPLFGDPFGQPLRINARNSPRDVAVEDFDGDGLLDLGIAVSDWEFFGLANLSR
ncbi:MAG: VCBS repeat-containing protein [Planctomycetes bacterium]|nr:VCBS repeat-containing protein [Planctomycetota bacterium]